MTLRYYQEKAEAAVFRELETVRATAAVMATGLGKTRLFTSVAKKWQGRVLVLVHREELLDQAVEALREQTGEPVEIEQGRRKSQRARIVVGMVQTLCQTHRLERLGPDAFSLIIPDEVHGYLAKSRRKVLDYFGDAKVFGVTATADRTDGQALGDIIDTVAFKMDIKEGIDSGHLVPLRIGRVRIESIDLRGVNKVRGDLNESKLEKVMLEHVSAVCSETVRLHPDRQGIIFWPGVESAELAAHWFNSRKPDSAIFISGKTDRDERKEMVARFKAGEHQWLCNCQIATEGFDAPGVSLIGIARPTTSRSLYTQMVGRGTRPDASCIAHLDGPENSEERRGSIAFSVKPNCVILDYVGNSGKHDLVSTLDLLDGGSAPEVKEIAKRLLEELESGDSPEPEELLALAAEQLERRKRAMADMHVMVKAIVDYVDPFKALSMDPKKLEELERMDLELGPLKMSGSQRQALIDFGVTELEVSNMSGRAGAKMLATLFTRKRHGYCDYSTLATLRQWGVPTSRVFVRQGQDALGYLIDRGFGKHPVDQEQLIALATGTY